MEKLGIILCSTISRTKNIEQASNVKKLTLSTTFKSGEIKSGEVSLKEYFDKVSSEKEVPKTSQPSTGEIVETIMEMANKYQNVIIITPNVQLSGTHQNVLLAMDMLEKSAQKRVKVVDSKCIAMSEAILADEVIKVSDQMEFDQLVKHIESLSLRFHTYAVPGSLKFLQRSGRVNVSKLVIGTLVNLKVMVKANQNSVVLYHKGRGYKSIFKKIEEELIQYEPSKVYFTSILEEQKVHDALMELFKKHNIEIVETKEADIVTATHFGPSSFGFTIIS